MKNSIIRFKCSIIALLMIVLNGVGAYASAPWTVNPSDYRYDMTLYLDVNIASQRMDYSKYVVAAFYENECRGIAEPLAIGDSKECLYLRLRSNQESGESMTFKYYDKDTDKIFSIPEESIQFESNAVIGYPSDPYVINIDNVKYYELTFSAGNGGSIEQESGSYAEGTQLTITANPSDGYSFAQWSDGNADNPRTLIVDKDMSLSAEFKVNSYRLIYLVDGAEYKEYIIEYGTEITPEANPEKEGYSFSGWEDLPETMPAKDMTVNGSFSVNSYKAIFKIGDKVIDTKTIDFGKPVVTPTAPAKEGYTFSGWKDVPETMPSYDVEINGSYTINQYKLTYTVDGQTYKEFTIDFGQKITAEVNPEKEGYSFSGWVGLPETMPARDVTVTGTFSVNSYKAIFKIGDEVIETKTIVFGQPVVAPTAPAKEGYTFSGWKDVPETMPAHDVEIFGYYTGVQYKLTYTVDGQIYKEFTIDFGQKITAEVNPEKEGYSFSGWVGLPETMPAHDVTVTGTFSINSYKAIFKIGDEVIETKTIVFGQPVVAPEAPAKEGYTFSGWKNVPETMPAHDVEIIGSYTGIQYKLTYTVDGQTYKEYSIDFGQRITAEADPEKEGYTFSGWVGLPETMPEHDVTVTGTFSINSYKAIFKIGDKEIEIKTIVFGQPVVAPVAPVKEGYTFSGWIGLPDTMPAHDVTVEGKFSVNSYKAVFKIGDEVIETKTIDFGQQVTAPSAPAKEGHTFAGWKDVPATMPAHDIEIIGSYAANQYKLTYVVDGKTYKEYTIDFGKSVTAEVAPEKEGHTFSGWVGLPETMPARDVTVTGTFSVNSYKAVFKIGDEVIETKTINFGQTVTAPSAPAKEGHTFAGWIDLPSTMPAQDIEILGSYTVNHYRLTIYLNDEIYSSEDIEYGAELTIEDPIVPEGNKFDGWTSEIPKTMPAYDIGIYGTYSELNSILSIFVDKNERVTVFSISGVLICKDVPWSEIYDLLNTGIYIINGSKMMITK